MSELLERHIAVDTGGLLLAIVVTIAGTQDRDAAHRLLTQLRGRFSTIGLVWADGGYAGRLVVWAQQILAITVEVVKRTDDVKGFAVLPRRWVVERRSRGSASTAAVSATTNHCPHTTKPWSTSP